MRYHSQQSEDIYLHNKFFNYRDGFFIELGAMDGVEYSNTKFFEDTLGWTGILIEPTYQYQWLVRNRPNCKNYNYAISLTEGEVDFAGYGALGGIVNTLSPSHIKAWGINVANSYKVKSIPIRNLLTDVKKVDFFSVDVEGGEYDVLQTYDWNIPTYIVLIELHEPEKNQLCRDFLISKGFEFDATVGANEVWVNKAFKK